jgi:hypothetical protein
MPLAFQQLLSMLHPLRRGAMVIAMLDTYSVFLDESEDGNRTVFAVGGFVGNADAWKGLQEAWTDRLGHNIVFHATDVVGGHNQFSDMDIPERQQLIDDLGEMILARNLFLVCAGVDVKTYKRYAPKPKRNAFGVNKYVVVFQDVVEHVALSFMRRAPLEETCAFAFEDNEYQYSIVTAFEELKATRATTQWPQRLGNRVFGSKTNNPLLQVGDFGAFAALKELSEETPGRVSVAGFFSSLKQRNRIFRLTKIGEEELAGRKAVFDKLSKGA